MSLRVSKRLLASCVCARAGVRARGRVGACVCARACGLLVPCGVPA